MNLNMIANELGCPFADSVSLGRVCIDSRKVKPGDLFIALRGDRFDGHDFMFEAAANGAAVILCERKAETLTVPQWVVADCMQTLNKIALAHRNTITIPIIALTGSNGKTTVKEMIAAILPKPSFATPGNLNNHIGVPLSILQLTAAHRYAVFELGANHLKEIAHTAAMVQPRITLVNNIGPAHIGAFGSLENIARAKGEIYENLPSDGIAVINNDDDFAHFWDDSLAGKRVIRFSLKDSSEVYASSIQFNDDNLAAFQLMLPNGKAAIQLQVPGEHSIRNALAAASCCYAAGIGIEDIAKGLNAFCGVAGRMTYRQGRNDAVIIDDTYNANLRSVLMAVEVLAKRKGRRILVLGDLAELGSWTQSHHEEIGYAAQRLKIDMLLTCGNHSRFSSTVFGGKHYQTQNELTEDLLTSLDKNTTILVKGSRSAEMEKIVYQLCCNG